MTATFSQQATSITLVDKDPFGPGYNGIKGTFTSAIAAGQSILVMFIGVDNGSGNPEFENPSCIDTAANAYKQVAEGELFLGPGQEYDMLLTGWLCSNAVSSAGGVQVTCDTGNGTDGAPNLGLNMVALIFSGFPNPSVDNLSYFQSTTTSITGSLIPSVAGDIVTTFLCAYGNPIGDIAYDANYTPITPVIPGTEQVNLYAQYRLSAPSGGQICTFSGLSSGLGYIQQIVLSLKTPPIASKNNCLFFGEF